MKPYIRNNSQKILFIASILLFAVVLIILHQAVYLYGDDFVYGTFAKNGVSSFFQKHAEHYSDTNGRALVHILVSLLLVFDVYVWRILNPFIILCIAYGIARTGKKIGKKTQVFSFVVSVALFSLLSISMTRESVYWLDGSMNYVFPMAMLFICYLCYRETLYTMPKRRIWLAVLSFFSAATVEQAGLMLFGLLLVETGYALIVNRKKPDVWHVGACIASIIGYASVALAPGTFARQSIEKTEESFSFGGVVRIVNGFVFHDATVLFQGLLAVCCILFLWIPVHNTRKERGEKAKYKFRWVDRIVSVLLLPYGIVFFLWYVGGAQKLRTFAENSPNVVFLFACAYLLLAAYALFIVMVRDGEHVPLIFYAAGIGAVMMLTVSPVIRERTMLAPLLAFFVPVISCLTRIFGRMKNKNLQTTLCVATAGIALFCFWRTAEGYKINVPVNEANLIMIQESKRTGDTNTLVLLPMTDDLYAYNKLQLSNYHLQYIKEYYGLKNEKLVVKQVYAEPENRILINEKLVYLNMNPVVENGVFLAPIGELSGEFGYTVAWSQTDNTATIVKDETIIQATLQENTITVNGEKRAVSATIKQMDYRTLIPAVELGEALGYTVEVSENENGGFDAHFRK